MTPDLDSPNPAAEPIIPGTLTDDPVSGDPELTLTARKAVRDRAMTARYSVSPTLYDSLIELFPALGIDTAKGEFARRMTQHLIYSRHYDAEQGYYPIPHDLLAAWAEHNPSGDRHGWRTADLLTWYTENVVPIRWSSYDHREQKCRRITPIWSDDFDERRRIRGMIATGLILGSIESRGGESAMLDFVSGQPIRRRAIQRATVDNEAYFARLIQDNDPNHPARELLDLLNTQGARVLKSLVQANLPSIHAEVSGYASDRETGIERLEHVSKILAGIHDHGYSMRYLTSRSGRTTRISAAGVNLNQLPRRIRKLLLHGCTELDLRSVQLAVVAKLYDCPLLSAFLTTGQSIWESLLGETGLGPEDKPIIKTTIYSICFGMVLEGLRAQLALGKAGRGDRILQRDSRGIGWAAADRFLAIPLIEELIVRRDAVRTQVELDGGMPDVFGRWVTWSEERDARSVMADVAQSYEVAIMLPLVEVIRAQERVQIVTWLHDGVTLYCSHPRILATAIEQIKSVTPAKAADLGILTHMEERTL